MTQSNAQTSIEAIDERFAVGDGSAVIKREDWEAAKADFERTLTAKDNAIQQAQCWAQEARTQKAIVHHIGTLVGCENDWETAEAVKARIDELEQAKAEINPARLSAQYATGLYRAGWDDAGMGRDYAPEASKEWRDVVSMLQASQSSGRAEAEPIGFMFPDDFERLSSTECCTDIYSVEAGHPEKGGTSVKFYAKPPAAVVPEGWVLVPLNAYDHSDLMDKAMGYHFEWCGYADRSQISEAAMAVAYAARDMAADNPEG